jgi:glycine/D-amino acid oxidase-like deaminating enzyme
LHLRAFALKHRDLCLSPKSVDVVICGAGIAGIAAAYYLAARHGIGDVLLVEERSPLMMTSDKSTEAYRNWWPGPGDAMVRFMNRSIDLLEELADLSGNAFHLNRRGYAFLTADPAKAEVYGARPRSRSGWARANCASPAVGPTTRPSRPIRPRGTSRRWAGPIWCSTRRSSGSASRSWPRTRSLYSTRAAAAG